MNRYSKLLICGMALIVGCKQSQTTKNVNVSVEPSPAYVFTEGFSTTSNSTDASGNPISTTISVTGPWSHFTLSLSNANSSDITIQQINFSGTAQGLDGSSIPISSSYGITNMIPAPVTTQTYLLDLKAGSTGTTLDVYLQSLPCNVASYNFSITGQIVGWVGTPSAPTSNFTKYFSLVTQGVPAGNCTTGTTQ